MFSLDELVRDMVEAAENYPGVNIIWYRTAVEMTATIASTFIGVVLVALMIGVPLMLAVELMFLNFPPLTAVLLEREHNAVAKNRRSFGLFVNDARKALRLQGERGGNINAVYFSLKWRSLAVFAFTINLLFFGGDVIVRLVTQACGGLFARL